MPEIFGPMGPRESTADQLTRAVGFFRGQQGTGGADPAAPGTQAAVAEAFADAAPSPAAAQATGFVPAGVSVPGNDPDALMRAAHDASQQAVQAPGFVQGPQQQIGVQVDPHFLVREQPGSSRFPVTIELPPPQPIVSVGQPTVTVVDANGVPVGQGGAVAAQAAEAAPVEVAPAAAQPEGFGAARGSFSLNDLAARLRGGGDAAPAASAVADAAPAAAPEGPPQRIGDRIFERFLSKRTPDAADTAAAVGDGGAAVAAAVDDVAPAPAPAAAGSGFLDQFREGVTRLTQGGSKAPVMPAAVENSGAAVATVGDDLAQKALGLLGKLNPR